MLFIAPITSKAPSDGRIGLEIPETEVKRAKLDTAIPLWIMLDKINADVLEKSYTLEDRTPLGAFSVAFTDAVVRGFQRIRVSRQSNLTSRT